MPEPGLELRKQIDERKRKLRRASIVGMTVVGLVFLTYLAYDVSSANHGAFALYAGFGVAFIFAAYTFWAFPRKPDDFWVKALARAERRRRK